VLGAAGVRSSVASGASPLVASSWRCRWGLRGPPSPPPSPGVAGGIRVSGRQGLTGASQRSAPPATRGRSQLSASGRVVGVCVASLGPRRGGRRPAGASWPGAGACARAGMAVGGDVAGVRAWWWRDLGGCAVPASPSRGGPAGCRWRRGGAWGTQAGDLPGRGSGAQRGRTTHWSRPRQWGPVLQAGVVWRGGSPRALGPTGGRTTPRHRRRHDGILTGIGQDRAPQDKGSPRQHIAKTTHLSDRRGPSQRRSKTKDGATSAPPTPPASAGPPCSSASRSLGAQAGAKAGAGRARDPGRGLTNAC
jgi:hypothetical protein